MAYGVSIFGTPFVISTKEEEEEVEEVVFTRDRELQKLYAAWTRESEHEFEFEHDWYWLILPDPFQTAFLRAVRSLRGRHGFEPRPCPHLAGPVKLR